MKTMTKSMAGLACLLAASAFHPAPARADDDDHDHREHHGGHQGQHHGGYPNGYYGHPNGYYGHRGDHRSGGYEAGGDRDWRRGHWERREHGGRNGWWWVVGSTLYPFGAPVYPYPAGPAAGDYATYYCPSLRAYFPEVSSCPLGWELVSPGR